MDGSKAAGGEAGGRARSFAKVVKITRTPGIYDGYIELAIYDGYNWDLNWNNYNMMDIYDILMIYDGDIEPTIAVPPFQETYIYHC